MKKIITDKKARKYTIGIPRALLYFRYDKLWENFFTSLGEDVILSDPTNKEMLRDGEGVAIDETCLSLKIYLGHVKSLIGKCDYILVPRISNFGRKRNMCTRFEALYDLVCNTFRNTDQKFIGYSVDLLEKKTEEDAFIEMGKELGFSYKEAKKAYRKAKDIENQNWKEQVKKQEQLYKSDIMKIVIAAHSYMVEDAYFGKPITDYLKQLGAMPIRADIVNRKEAVKQSHNVSPTLKWEMSREIVGSLNMHKDDLDGIILMSAFPCGPDSMVNEMIARKFSDVPVLNLVIDGQNGSAGVETRLESFVDILKLKRGEL